MLAGPPSPSNPPEIVVECDGQRVWPAQQLRSCKTCDIYDGGVSDSYPVLNNTNYNCLGTCDVTNGYVLFEAVIDAVQVTYCKQCPLGAVIIEGVTCLMQCLPGTALLHNEC